MLAVGCRYINYMLLKFLFSCFLLLVLFIEKWMNVSHLEVVSFCLKN